MMLKGWASIPRIPAAHRDEWESTAEETGDRQNRDRRDRKDRDRRDRGD